MRFFFSLDWLGAVLLLILIMCGLIFDGLTPFFEMLVKLYPIIIIIAILYLIASTGYYIYKEKNTSKWLMCAFCKSHMLFFGLSVPYEILWALTLDSDPFTKMISIIPIGFIFYLIFVLDNVMIISAIESEEKSMMKMGITGVIGWVLCFVLLI